MEKFKFASALTLSAIAVLSLGLSPAFATTRSVSISVPDGKLQLTNGSPVTVTYTAECYDKSTGTNVLTSASNVTLDPNKSVTYSSVRQCASGTTTKALSSGVYLCSSSVTYANAGTLCSAGSSVCTFQKLNSLGVTHSDLDMGYYWANPGVTNWSSWDGKSWNDYNISSSAPVVSNKNSMSCKSGPAGTGANSFGCWGDMVTSLRGTACCPNDNGFASCKVTITSATPSTGHLQSPQFKGGASF